MSNNLLEMKTLVSTCYLYNYRFISFCHKKARVLGNIVCTILAVYHLVTTS